MAGQYTSAHTGQEIDNAVSSITSLQNQITNLQNQITQLSAMIPPNYSYVEQELYQETAYGSNIFQKTFGFNYPTNYVNGVFLPATVIGNIPANSLLVNAMGTQYFANGQSEPFLEATYATGTLTPRIVSRLFIRPNGQVTIAGYTNETIPLTNAIITIQYTKP